MVAFKCSSENRSTVFILIAIASGIIIGLCLKYFTKQPWTDREIMHLQFIGELFLRSVNCLILPLIVSSIISASCHLSKSGGIGMKALYYYTATTSLAIALSVVLVQTIRPGEFYRNDNFTRMQEMKKYVTVDIFLDLLRNLMPDSIVKACLSQYQTKLIDPNDKTKEIHEWEISHEYNTGTNVLGIVSFSLLIGIAIGSMNEKGKPLEKFFQAFCIIVMEIMDWVVIIIPIGILFLMPAKILQTDNIGIMLSRLGIYVATVLFGLFLHALIVLPCLYFIFTQKSPFKILKKIGPAVITAIGTSSSTATVPMTIKCLDEIGVNKKVSRFIAPIGATINMDGIALYETIGAIFIIQLRGLDFSLMSIIAIAITCTVSCIGAAGLPNGGYVMLIIVLESIGIPAEDVTLIITIDCFVDRLRTTVNIVADALGAALISHFVKDETQDIEPQELEELQKSFLQE